METTGMTDLIDTDVLIDILRGTPAAPPPPAPAATRWRPLRYRVAPGPGG